MRLGIVSTADINRKVIPGAHASAEDRDSWPSPAASSGAPRRYYGSIAVDPVTMSRDAGQVADEVVKRLVGHADAHGWDVIQKMTASELIRAVEDLGLTLSAANSEPADARR